MNSSCTSFLFLFPFSNESSLHLMTSVSFFWEACHSMGL
uniref:Uncharacterized protein n=1 Tax=Arundo donax TaxID=35708 RepID=A0A0A8Y1D1_ARUDO